MNKTRQIKQESPGRPRGKRWPIAKTITLNKEQARLWETVGINGIRDLLDRALRLSGQMESNP